MLSGKIICCKFIIQIVKVNTYWDGMFAPPPLNGRLVERRARERGREDIKPKGGIGYEENLGNFIPVIHDSGLVRHCIRRCFQRRHQREHTPYHRP